MLGVVLGIMLSVRKYLVVVRSLKMFPDGNMLAPLHHTYKYLSATTTYIGAVYPYNNTSNSAYALGKCRRYDVLIYLDVL